jgi:hypothetical protein
MLAKVTLSFARMPDTELDNFAQAIIDSMTGNAAYASPPITMAALQAAKDDFTAKLAAAQTGGVADTAAKENSRQVLLGMLRQLAAFVQMKCANDRSILLTSGFQAQGERGASVPLTRPEGLALNNERTGRIVATMNPVNNANMYEGRIKLIDGDWLPSVFSGNSQRIVFQGLTRGKDYTVEVRALGGLTGQSDWSDPSSHMSM